VFWSFFHLKIENHPHPQQIESVLCLVNSPFATSSFSLRCPYNYNINTSTLVAVMSQDGDTNTPEQAANDHRPSDVQMKKPSLQQRMRLYQQKVNQANQLNQVAVQEEAKRHLGQAPTTQKASQKASIPVQDHALLQEASRVGIEAKVLAEPAADAVYKAQMKQEKEELIEFAVNDYYSPQGQFRHYQRDLKSLPQQQTQAVSAKASALETFNPLEVVGTTMAAGNTNEREGARRLASEMHRRIAKSQKAESKRKDREDSDVSYINQRNKRFNQKINRTYDKHTAEIRQNLERGTAL
jgi:pre-mRNA-splicing factor SYF2